MKNQELARLFYREIVKIHLNNELDEVGKVEQLYRLLNLLFVESTRDERIQFTTLFSRIAYVCQKKSISRQKQFFIHAFRKQARSVFSFKNKYEVNEVHGFGLKVVAETIADIFNRAIPEDVQELIPENINTQFSPVEIQSFKSSARVVVLDVDTKKEQLIARDEELAGEEVYIQYNIAERNENFNPSIDAILNEFDFPITLHLLDVEVDKDGVYRPRAFIIEPDYLVDVTAVAECFKDFGEESIFYLMKKYLPFQTSKHLMIGNIANFFLDELMNDSEVTFKETFPKVFGINPLAFSMLDNREIREIMGLCQRHYVNLKNMVKSEFQKVEIGPADCFLEPSFCSALYGLQGRLDALYQNPTDIKDVKIVELKSGKTFKPNKYGINHNHYTQTLLYSLLIKSAFGHDLDPACYILYSGAETRPLRYAPTVKAQQFEALKVRNQIVTYERKLTKLGTSPSNILDQINAGRFPRLKGFLQRDIIAFEKVYQGMSVLERKYFIAFSSFIAKEHQLAKTGIEGMDKANGRASLWLSDYASKQERFDIISHLEIENNQAEEEIPLITFMKTSDTHPLANFRKGDIAVLYPLDEERDNVLSNQIFKCTIIEMNPTQVLIRLRSRQFNNRIFKQYKSWNLEHDLMDSSFNSMYKGLYQFAQSSTDKKARLLTTEAPTKGELQELPLPKDLTDEQQNILQKALSAKDYFLLWGPPGTGKTSKMIRSMVHYLYHHTEEDILLLAYTNRAVDEICEAIENAEIPNVKDQYIRIGSRYSTQAIYQPQLLNAKMDGITSRKDLKGIIASHRVYVATVASMNSKMELFKLKNFKRVIIDEASQILEPVLVGLLPHFEQFILVGDHKQLPAVVVQNNRESGVEDQDLKAIGLKNLRNSLFERLYQRCSKNNWDWAYANLSHQGRMHQEIMQFPNVQFYEKRLNILPDNIPVSSTQKNPLDLSYSENDALQKTLARNRMVFIPTPAEESLNNRKVNKHEAKLMSTLVHAFQSLYQQNNKDFHPFSLGIITPYRAQIAQIKKQLQDSEIDTTTISIDTVERYQGSSREVILISLCTNNISQLKSMISLSDDGVDRKLNVALTRAREHIVLVGNPNILKNDPIYQELMEYCEVYEMKETTVI